MANINNNTLQQDLSRGRKRRNSEDEDMAECTTQATKPMRRLSKCIKISELKRHKNGIQKRTTRGALLETMDKDALINIINSLLDKQPTVRKDIMNYIPAPTILSSMNVLVDLEKKFINSFPFNKNGPGKDDYTFSRVREPLADLIDTINQYANHFTTSNQVFPSTYFTFLDHATQMAHRLPNWDNEDNNLLKKNLYQDLNDFWKLAIQTTASNLRQGEYYSPDLVAEWAKSLAQHNGWTNGVVFIEAIHEFTRQLGYLIGLQPTMMESDTANSNDMIMTAAGAQATTPVCHLTPLETNLTPTYLVGDRR